MTKIGSFDGTIWYITDNIVLERYRMFHQHTELVFIQFCDHWGCGKNSNISPRLISIIGVNTIFKKSSFGCVVEICFSVLLLFLHTAKDIFFSSYTLLVFSICFLLFFRFLYLMVRPLESWLHRSFGNIRFFHKCLHFLCMNSTNVNQQPAYDCVSIGQQNRPDFFRSYSQSSENPKNLAHSTSK